jgi:hypothetical protein
METLPDNFYNTFDKFGITFIVLRSQQDNGGLTSGIEVMFKCILDSGGLEGAQDLLISDK